MNSFTNLNKRNSSISTETNELPKNGNSETGDENFVMNESPANDVDVQKESQTKSIRSNFEAILNFLSMSPSVTMDAFKNCYSAILASGTLKPIETLKTEFVLKFDWEMDGKQVISDNQIFANVVSKSSNHNPMPFTYKKEMNNSILFIELLRTVLDFCKKMNV
uniref:Uncharacterized protein n=1 Tax=Panagrolaimus sp. PS1159 TaxID=55785 RepID=A0AC35F476_9BILA